MDTNPSAEVSMSDDEIADTLGRAFLGAEAEPEAEDPAKDTPSEAEASAEEPPPEEQQQEPEDDAEEVEYEGKAYKVPRELKSALLRQSDYTQKTQEVATLRRQAEDRAQFVEAKEQFLAHVSDELAEIRAMESQAKQFESLDWAALYSADPGQALKLRDQRDDLQRKAAEKKAELGRKAQAFQQAQESHQAKQWQLAVEAARQRIGRITAEEDAAMLKAVKALGFEDSEVKAKLADPRLLTAIYKAAKWDALQERKPLAEKKVATAKPIKASSRGSNLKEGQIAHIKEQLRKTGRAEYAEQYFAHLFDKR